MGCQHAMVAVAVQARRRDQGGEVVAERQQGEGQRDATVALGFGKAIDNRPAILAIFLIKDSLLACRGESISSVRQPPVQLLIIPQVLSLIHISEPTRPY